MFTLILIAVATVLGLAGWKKLQDRRHHAQAWERLKDYIPLEKGHQSATVATEVFIPAAEEDSIKKCTQLFAYMAKVMGEGKGKKGARKARGRSWGSIQIGTAVIVVGEGQQKKPTAHFYFVCEAAKERTIKRELKRKFPDAMLVPFKPVELENVLEAWAAKNPYKTSREIINEHRARRAVEVTAECSGT